MKRLAYSCFAVVIGAIATVSPATAEEIDASDPTKIYSYAGAGVKYSEYTNGEYMTELRAIGNWAASDSDMVMFELGYGWHQGDLEEGSNQDLTNGRLRWFHLFPMDYSVASGYRGIATQIDLQLAGSLKGTDGQNTLAAGVLPAFGINENWSFYLAANLVSTWDKSFSKWNGAGIGLAPLLVYSPDNWWNGAYVQIWPNYTWFLSGELKNEGSGNVDVILGGAITDKIMWSGTFQKNVDKDLRSFRRGEDTGVTNDWNLFFSVTRYF